jgi:hypothetical protein
MVSFLLCSAASYIHPIYCIYSLELTASAIRKDDGRAAGELAGDHLAGELGKLGAREAVRIRIRRRPKISREYP